MMLKTLILTTVLIFSSFGQASECTGKVTKNEASLDRATQITTGILEFRADKSCTLQELAVMSDPQLWATCNPEVFKQSYVTDQKTPPALGTSWKGLLFEDVRSLWRLPLSDKKMTIFKSKNLIHFDIQVFEEPNDKGEYYRADYYLHEASISNMMGLDFRSALDVDEGYVTIKKANNGDWLLRGVKQVRYKFLTYHAGAELPLMDHVVNKNAPGKISELLKSIAEASITCQH